jgi:hypothetical protein
MKFDNMENMLKYANNTICLAESKTLPGGWDIGLVTNNYGLPGWPQGEKVCLATQDNMFYPIGRVKDWEISSPINGYVSHENGQIYYLERDPKRVWKVGFCSQNTSPKDFWAKAPNHRSSLKAVSDLQKKKFGIYSLSDPSLTGKNTAVLSSKYAIIATRLFYRGNAIANLDFKNKKLLFTGYGSSSVMDFHLRNLSSKLGAFTPVCVEVQKQVISLKGYDYEFDV